VEKFFSQFIPLNSKVPNYVMIKDFNNEYEILQYEPLFRQVGRNLYPI